MLNNIHVICSHPMAVVILPKMKWILLQSRRRSRWHNKVKLDEDEYLILSIFALKSQSKKGRD